MATNRINPQFSLTLYPELKELVDKVASVSNKPKARVIYEACVRGLKDTIKELSSD